MVRVHKLVDRRHETRHVDERNVIVGLAISSSSLRVKFHLNAI